MGLLLLFFLFKYCTLVTPGRRQGWESTRCSKGCSAVVPHLLNLSLGSVVLGTWSAGTMWSVKLSLHCRRSATTQAEFSGINLDLLQDSWQNNLV